MLFTAVTFIAFTALVAVIAWWRTRDDDLSTQDGYFLAGRSLTGPVIAGSLMLTNLSTEQLIGQTGQSFSTNMGPIAWEVTSAAALVILALVFLPRYLKMGLTTVPEFLENRYDSTTKRIVSIMFLLGYLLTYLPTVLYSGALVFNQIFEVDKRMGVSQMQGVIITAVAIGIVGGCYAIFGGLKAVAVSDTINGVGLLIGGLMIPFLALNVLGHASGSESSVAIMDGVRYLIHNHADMLNSIAPAQSEAPAVPWPTVFLGLVCLGFQSWCTHQSFIQRVLAAENLKEAQKGALYCAFLKILGFMFLALPGVIAYAIFNIEGTQVSMMDDAYPALITRVVPQPVMGFFAAVMFGAILSSFNSVLNSVNTMFTMDIYKEFINKNASDKKLVSVGKNIGIVFAIFSMIVGPMVYFFPAGLKTFLDSFVMLVGLPVLSGVFGGFFFNCLPKYSARFIMVFHIICYGGFMLLSPSYSLFGGNEGSIHYLYAVSILWPLEMLIMYLMHRRNKSKGAEVWVQQDVGAVDLTPWKYSKLVSVIVIVCVLLVYLAFSPLGIGA